MKTLKLFLATLFVFTTFAFNIVSAQELKCVEYMQWPNFKTLILEQDDRVTYHQVIDVEDFMNEYGGEFVDANPSNLPLPDVIGYFHKPNKARLALITFVLDGCVVLYGEVPEEAILVKGVENVQ